MRWLVVVCGENIDRVTKSDLFWCLFLMPAKREKKKVPAVF